MTNPKIISVDFDGTLCQNAYPEIGAPNGFIIAYVKDQKALGAELILNTMREGKMLDVAVEWCREQGVEFDAVNDNLGRMKAFYANNPRKIFANEYIDDHNVSFSEIALIVTDQGLH
jgi:hypothetical protein